MRDQRGGTIVGFIIGVVFGLAAALTVAVYVTKVPVPFLNKASGRTAEHDAAESRKNKDWDPNAPLYGKNPARPAAPAASGAVGSAPDATAAASSSGKAAAAPQPTKVDAKTADAKADAKPASGDPLGDLAKARAAAAAGNAPAAVATAANSGGAVDPFDYFVQTGAFRTSEDAEAQRAKLAIMGWEAKVTEREQSGRTVFRVRLGPYGKKDDADRTKDRLDGAGLETALVRVQR